jgi:hypothetical protein
MTSTPVGPGGPSNFHPEHGAQAGTERFMLTLCQLATAVPIRPPRAPQLRPYTFFMSRTYQLDGGEKLCLHMGYFKTLEEAERWAETVRRHYPSVFAGIAPAAFLQAADPEAPSLSAGAFHRVAAQGSDQVPVQPELLSDTAVLRILGTRRVAPTEDGSDESSADQIALLRPEDTGVRKALKEAVVQGGQVSFAVQLRSSTQPIDTGSVRPLAIFKSHTLYSTETHRKGHARYFLRLGFFEDPMSAKQVAVQVLSTFDSAAVIPVVEPEITRAREATLQDSAIPFLMEHSVEEEMESRRTWHSLTHAEAISNTPYGASAEAETAAPERRARTARQRRIDADLLSESGVRHLKVEVQEELSGRWKVVRLEGALVDRDRPTA